MIDTVVAKRPSWFVINVIALCILAPWATYWFQQHLQLYFTEIVIVGGAFSLWVMLRAMWAMFEKTADVDTTAYSRKLLASPDLTILLIVAFVMLSVLWFRTASIYIQYQGAPGEGEYLVEVIQKSDGSPLIPSTPTNAGNAVVGGPILWQGQRSELECRILHPVKYEVLPCAVEPGRSTRINVPGSFRAREFHLLRLIPSGALYPILAPVDQTPLVRRELVLKRGQDIAVLHDLRRQVLYTGAAENEMPILLELEQPELLRQYLFSRMLAKGNDADASTLATAILTSSTSPWPTFYVRAGDVIELTVRIAEAHDDAALPQIAPEFSMHYTVTTDRIQTVWFPAD